VLQSKLVLYQNTTFQREISEEAFSQLLLSTISVFQAWVDTKQKGNCDYWRWLRNA
jgi:hypothetical protein